MAEQLELTKWDLTCSPFAGGLRRGLFFEGASQREAMARLRYVRTSGKLALVVGSTGIGKSMLLEAFARDCRLGRAAVAKISLHGLGTRDFYGQLGTALGCNPLSADDVPQLYRQFADRLFENGAQSLSTVVLLDDLHQAGPDVISQVLRMAKLCSSLNVPPTIVLACQEEQLGRLGTSLIELVDLRIELEPWDELDTVGYLQLALVEAGCGQPLFDDQSLSEIHRIAGGVPRQVNRLAEHSLLLGSATVRSAHSELNPELAK